MSVVPWEDGLKKYWINYAGKISGRDKIYRLIQYSARAIYFQLKQAGAPKETWMRFYHISKVFSTGRKFQRMGKFIDNWFKAYKHLVKHGFSAGNMEEIAQALGLLAYAADTIFYVWDLLAWIEAAKISKFPSLHVKYNRNRWNAIRYGLKAIKGSLLIQVLKPGTKQYYSHRRIAIKSALDINNPLKGLGFLKLNDGQLGVIGIVTSIIGIYDDFHKK
mmetsp:Transcript_2288/g.3273  ORF Transcript_2288/g.3273 Transcript_2288/m.3273 type:complete len:219 (+) Transcript_2288:32-688(+)